MITKINFAKMHGLGNDFVIINKASLDPQIDFVHLAKTVSNRYTGIGCDQFVIYDKQEDYCEMIIFNQDGSLAKACGNASRCLTKLISQKSGDKKFLLKVFGREIKSELLETQEVRVNMGNVDFSAAWIPAKADLLSVAERYAISPNEIICADVGNPHIIIFANLSHEDKELIGKTLQNCELFPEGINVNFARVTESRPLPKPASGEERLGAYVTQDPSVLNVREGPSNGATTQVTPEVEFRLEVFERGAGFTLACGSGACASFAAAERLGFIDATAKVIFLNGCLKMSKEGNDIIMTGPATLIAYGEYCYESK